MVDGAGEAGGEEEGEGDPNAHSIKCRQVGLAWTGGKGKTSSAGADDSTGVYLWGASVLLSRWLVQKRSLLKGKRVCELGAGCGLPSLTAWIHTEADLVIATDLFQPTLENLAFNVALNRAPGVIATDLFQPTLENLAFNVALNRAVRGRKHMEVQGLDWADQGTWPKEQVDVCLGSDLIYDREQVPLLVSVIDALLQPSGLFLYACPPLRDGLPLLLETLEAKGYTCTSFPAPAEWYRNPLDASVATRDADYAIHLPELKEQFEGSSDDPNGPINLYTIQKADA
ncbi:hypothetical protein T484DRAFT_1899114 [Baffinella frigidus]|nr:hypothetical protein T484DRAFT_1899114 [Cryptophyta sp. CCMP2293]